MFTNRHYFQVFNSIVCFNHVFMMHNIAFFKIFFAIDFYEEFLIKKISILFNDKPVLKNPIATRSEWVVMG